MRYNSKKLLSNGAGPENINLNDPEYTDQTTTPGPYLVGVHYYSSGGLFSSDYGPSEAMIHIYLGGALAGTYTQVLNATGNFWEVAGVIWTNAEQRVQEINRFYNTPPWASSLSRGVSSSFRSRVMLISSSIIAKVKP